MTTELADSDQLLAWIIGAPLAIVLIAVIVLGVTTWTHTRRQRKSLDRMNGNQLPGGTDHDE